MSNRRFPGIIPLIACVFLSIWVWVTPPNKYAFDGPTSIPPDADTVLVLILLSSGGIVAAALAVWRSRVAMRPMIRWSIAAPAIGIAAYDLVRLIEAVPHFQG